MGKPFARGSVLRLGVLAWLALAPLCPAPAGPSEEAQPSVIEVAPAAPSLARGSADPLERALERVTQLRAQQPHRPIIVELAPGDYRLRRPLRIGPAQSGSTTGPLVIRGAPGGLSRIRGSLSLDPIPGVLDPALLARLPALARDHVRAYRLPEAALTSARIQSPDLLRGPHDPLGLEVYDERGALAPAQWPNEGWGKVAVGSADAALPAFAPGDDRMARWAAEPDLWAAGYWRWDWLFEMLPVTWVDPDAKRLGLAELPYEGIRTGARFRIVHALSELDQPGEWWRDRAAGLLLAWPRQDATDRLEVAVADALLSLEDASHVRIERLTLERSRGDLIRVRGGRDIVLRDSKLAWAGANGALFEAARDSGIENCDIEDIGRVAVKLSGGDRASLTPGGMFLRDSRLTRYARHARTQSPAVRIEGVGALVSGNYIHDAIDAAVDLHGNDHRVIGNEIARLLAGATDDGAIYSGRDWTARGTIIEGNFVHDIRADPGAEVKGVYLDDEASGFTVRRNLFLRVDQAVFIGGGRDNRVEGNVFVAASPAIHIDSRGETWAAGAIRDPASQLRAALAAMPVDAPLWRDRYPGLADILLRNPGVARDNRIEHNVFVESSALRVNDGGRSSNQVIRDNAGPDGIRLRTGEDLAGLAGRSMNPADFADLVDAAGRNLFDLDTSPMRRSAMTPTRDGRRDH